MDIRLHQRLFALTGAAERLLSPHAACVTEQTITADEGLAKGIME